MRHDSSEQLRLGNAGQDVTVIKGIKGIKARGTGYDAPGLALRFSTSLFFI
jgi:hypothetical protein